MHRTLLAAALLFAGIAPAAAVCPGLNVLYEDSFDRLQPTWSAAAGAVRVDAGRLVMTAPSGMEVWIANNAGLYDDADLCVNVTTVAGVEPEEAKAGAVFWYEDVNNFYVFEIAPNGKASVWRRQRGKWLEQVRWQDAENANAGDGGVNELRVTMVGGAATLYVNGAEFAKIEGSPPESGQLIGLFAASPEAAAATFAFDDLRVTNP